MDEPFESMRKDMFQILDDVTTTSELYNFQGLVGVSCWRLCLDYFMTYLGEALLAIHEDGIPLMGTFPWCK